MKFLCWLFTGHRNAVLRARPIFVRLPFQTHVWTECIDCGHESHGWDYGVSR